MFRRLKFKNWFLGVLHQNIFHWQNIQKIFDKVEKYWCIIYLQLIANNVHSFNLFLYHTYKPGLGVKNHILKISQKCVIFNMTIMHLFRMFCDSWLNVEILHIICHQFLTQPIESFSTSPNIFVCYAWWHILIPEWASGISSNQLEAHGPIFMVAVKEVTSISLARATQCCEACSFFWSAVCIRSHARDDHRSTQSERGWLDFPRPFLRGLCTCARCWRVRSTRCWNVTVYFPLDDRPSENYPKARVKRSISGTPNNILFRFNDRKHPLS